MPVLKAGETPGGGGGNQPPPFTGPRQDWQFLIGPAAGGYDHPIPHPGSVQVTWRLTDAHEASFTVNAAAGYDQGINPFLTDLHILYAGHPLFRGRTGLGSGAQSDQLSGGAHTASFTATSYRGLLERRALYHGDTLAWTGQPVNEIVWGLISQTQAKPGGQLGIVQGAGFEGGWAWNTATKTAEPGDMVAEKIDDLAYVTPGGFDWDLTPRDPTQHTLDMWPGARTADHGVTLQYGDSLTGSDWTRDLDGSTYANAAQMTGSITTTTTSGGTTADTTSTIYIEADSSDIATRPEGRFDAVYSTDEADPATLRARTVLQLEGASLLVPSYTIPLRPGAWGGPGHIWVGDTIRVSLASGRFAGVLETMRVLELAADIGADATRVTLTLGQPARSAGRELKRLIRELRKARRTRVAGVNPRSGYTVTSVTVPDTT